MIPAEQPFKLIKIGHVFPLDGLKCHTTSQVVRMFAFELKQIKPDDIIIMSDADAFPSNIFYISIKTYCERYPYGTILL
jgi:hypothetical protein